MMTTVVPERNPLFPIQNNCAPEVSVSFQMNLRVPAIFKSAHPFESVSVSIPEATYDGCGRLLAPQFSLETREDKIQVPTCSGGCVEYIVYSEISERRVMFQYTALLDAAREPEGKTNVGKQLVSTAKAILPILLHLRGGAAPTAFAALSVFSKQ